MAKQIRRATLSEIHMLDETLRDLKNARNTARLANATKAHKAICRAIKSTDGALRHAWGAYQRAKRQAEQKAKKEEPACPSP